MSKLDDAVTEGEGGWDFACPVTDGSCGDPAAGTSFTSTGWPTKKTATARGQEHFDEHLGNGVTSSLEDFRAKHGLTVDATGVVTAKDLA
jgi:hypothetical protein